MQRNKQKIEETTNMEKTSAHNINDEKIYLKIAIQDMQSSNHNKHSINLDDGAYNQENSRGTLPLYHIKAESETSQSSASFTQPAQEESLLLVPKYQLSN